MKVSYKKLVEIKKFTPAFLVGKKIHDTDAWYRVATYTDANGNGYPIFVVSYNNKLEMVVTNNESTIINH